MTNIERITHIMEFSKAGPMAQLVIMDAVFKHCKAIVENKETVIQEMENSFVHGPAWVQAAKIILDELELSEAA